MELSGYMYRCSAGETFDGVALDVYGDEQYAAELLCANPEYAALAVFGGGETLYLPVVVAQDDDDEYEAEAAAEPDKAPWKE